jgi:hypothetical protein
MADMDDDELLEALELPAADKADREHTPVQERVIAGFEDICNFRREHGRAPAHGADGDIFERIYAVRLDRIREQKEFHELLAPIDEFGLLAGAGEAASDVPDDDEALLAELEIDSGSADSVATLTHVKPRADVQAAEDVSRRTVCKDFAQFEPLFERIQKELERGERATRRFQRDAEIKQGDFFILGGQTAYVAEVGEEFRTEQDRKNARLRVIFDNKTESDPLLRSFQRALYKDEAGRRITEPGAGPLFEQEDTPYGEESGTIYVLRSNSDHPQIAPHREVIHKIGVTGGPVKTRVANAAEDPTFLFAGVEIVATYALYNVNRSKLENLLHRFFSAVRLDVEMKDRFGKPVKPQEWFLVPLPVVDEVVRRIKDETIVDFEYDAADARLKPIPRAPAPGAAKRRKPDAKRVSKAGRR